MEIPRQQKLVNSILVNPGDGLGGIGKSTNCTDLIPSSSICNAAYRLQARSIPESNASLGLLVFGASIIGVSGLKNSKYRNSNCL